MYGGDGRVNFALPDFRGRAPLHVGAGFTQGQQGGSEAHTVNISEMPAHNHIPVGASTQTVNIGTPVGNMCGQLANNNLYSTTPDQAMNAAGVTNTGGSQAHNNLQPFLCLNFIVALIGIFPSRN
jgi:microcystin-dependent protein